MPVPHVRPTVKEMLSEPERAKLDAGPDDAFYDSPRFVAHADDGFLERLTDTYAAVLSGLNAAELDANDALDEWFLQDLNREQTLPLDDDHFDAVLCALSVQYLQYPGAVFAEFARVLVPGGVLVVSFTDRMFPTKAVRAWRSTDMNGRTDLVESYCEAGGLCVTDVLRDRPERDPLVAVVAQPLD